MLNRRSEFGVNHLPRLEAVNSELARNKLLEKEAREKANLLSDLNCFKNVVLSVVTKMNICANCKFIETDSNGCTTCRAKRKRTAKHESDTVVPEGGVGSNRTRIKRQRTMLASTPIWDHRGEIRGGSSPNTSDTSTVVLNFSGGSFSQESYITPARGDKSLSDRGCDIESFQSLGLTPALRKLLIHPSNVDDYIATREILQETINLTRAAILVGLINEDIGLEEFSIKLTENSLYRCYSVIDPIQSLMENLDLDGWSANDFETMTSMNKPSLVRKKGVLDNIVIDVWSDQQSNLDLSDLSKDLIMGSDIAVERAVGTYTSDRKQALIMSLFSPKVLSTVDNTKE